MKRRPSLIQYALFYSFWALAICFVAGMVAVIVDFSFQDIVFYICLGLYGLTEGLVITGAIVTMLINPDQSIYPSNTENKTYEAGKDTDKKVRSASPEDSNSNEGINSNNEHSGYQLASLFSVHILDPLFEGIIRGGKRGRQPNANKTLGLFFRKLY
jgi:hypothetical protein